MKRTLILKSDKDEFEKFYIDRMQTSDVITRPIYKYWRGIGWILQVVWIEKLHFPFEQIWYGRWWEELEGIERIIVFDRNLGWKILENIKKRKSNIQIIVWYWNIVKKNIPKQYMKFCEVWSFDRNDCKKFDYKCNTQFYFPDFQLQEKEYVQDVIFVGRDKGRYGTLKEIEKDLIKYGVNINMKVIKDETSMIDYKELLNEISRSKAILDVPQEGQEGMTARVMESIFLRKKLITTNTNILYKEYFDKQNMYVWGMDKRDLKEFLNDSYRDNKKNVKMRKFYSFTEWIKRF